MSAKVFDNLPLEIGRVYGRPAYYVSHPSGKWALSNSFVSVFIYLRDLCDNYGKGKPIELSKLRAKMRKEVQLWQERIKVED